MFDQALRDPGLSERGFFAEQRQIYLRQQLEYALVDGLETPKPLLEALAAGDDADARDRLFRAARERRRRHPGALRRGAEELFRRAQGELPGAGISRSFDILARLARRASPSPPTSATTTPRRPTRRPRTSIHDARKAQAAADRFPDRGRGVRGRRENQGRRDVRRHRQGAGPHRDATSISARFPRPTCSITPSATPPSRCREGGVSGVVKGQFGYLIVHVVSVTPGSVQPFADVVAVVKKDIATERAAGDVAAVHDKIEDARVSGKSLIEAAKSVGLEAQAIPAVDAAGTRSRRQAGRNCPRRRRCCARCSPPTSASTTRRSTPRTAAMSGSTSPRSIPRTTSLSTRSRTPSRSMARGAGREGAERQGGRSRQAAGRRRDRSRARQSRGSRGQVRQRYPPQRRRRAAGERRHRRLRRRPPTRRARPRRRTAGSCSRLPATRRRPSRPRMRT